MKMYTVFIIADTSMPFLNGYYCVFSFSRVLFRWALNCVGVDM